jgi:hypothetical protein
MDESAVACMEMQRSSTQAHSDYMTSAMRRHDETDARQAASCVRGAQRAAWQLRRGRDTAAAHAAE